MPPPPAGPIAPYHVYVAAVNDSGGSPVSGAQFVLKNTTKATQAPAIISNEANSNIVLNVADAGAWDNGDTLELDVAFGGETAAALTTIDTATFPLGRDMSTISLAAGAQDAEMTLSLVQGVAQTAAKTIDAALTLSQLSGIDDGGQANAEGATTLSELLQLIYNTDGSVDVGMALSQALSLAQTTEGLNSASMTLSQSLTLSESAQATTDAALILSQFVDMADGSPIGSEMLLAQAQSITFTTTTIIIGLVTPPGRTIYIKADNSST